MTGFGGLLFAGLLAAFLAGCVQMPTENQGAVDMRPRIGFNVAPGVDGSTARVVVDGLDLGPLSNYRDNVGSLPLLPGTHLIQVQDSGRVIFQERVYLADGARRNLLVSQTIP